MPFLRRKPPTGETASAALHESASAYASIRQHTSAYVRIRQRRPPCTSLRPGTQIRVGICTFVPVKQVQPVNLSTCLEVRHPRSGALKVRGEQLSSRLCRAQKESGAHQHHVSWQKKEEKKNKRSQKRSLKKITLKSRLCRAQKESGAHQHRVCYVYR
jgi:hypothetical protein